MAVVSAEAVSPVVDFGALSARGCRVAHMKSATKAEADRVTSFARVEEMSVTYPGGAQERLI